MGINFPTNWTIQNNVPPQPPLDTEVGQITQSPSRDVEIRFASNHIMCLPQPSSLRSTSSRMSSLSESIPPYKVSCPPTTDSIFDLPSENQPEDPIIEGVRIQSSKFHM